MSARIRRFGRVAFPALVVLGLIVTIVGLRLFARAAPPGPSVEDQRMIGHPTFTIGPIDGLTTTWHWAPDVTSIPLGTIVQFFQPAPPDAAVIWAGADEVQRDADGSTALCALLETGQTTVRVQVSPPVGAASSSQSVLNVVDIPVGEITASMVDVWADAIDIDEDLPQEEVNELTMEYFFEFYSIAALREVEPGQYRTSVKKLVNASIQVNPPGFAPLMEWRFDGQPVDAPPVVGAPGPPGSMAAEWNSYGVGLTTQRTYAEVGYHSIEVGPILSPAEIEIETYSVMITSHTSSQDIVPEGEPIVFEAVTDPPGYENEITWLSSTKYGTAQPILGEGPTFVVEFNDTWGPWPEDPDVPFQWLGVRGDNAVFNQDLKCPPLDNQVTDIVSLPADFQSQIANSPLTAAYEATLASMGWSLSYPDASEVFATGLPPAAEGARFAMVPVLDGNGFGIALYNYTYKPADGTEGADVAQVFDEEPDNRITFFLDPDLQASVSVFIDDKGCLTDATGQAGGGPYFQCVLARLFTLAMLGLATGTTEACLAACAAGGLANPACAVCVAGVVVVLFAIWWDCD